jgi:hypothetical protein
LGGLFGQNNSQPQQWVTRNAASNTGQTPGLQSSSNLGNMFSGMGGNMLGGLGLMGASQMIGNPSAPKMPDSYNQFMSQMQQGGTPGMQSANQYYQGVLSGQNQGAYDAAYNSIDLNHEQEIRDLQSRYRSLGRTDWTNDSAYKRDENLINDRYVKDRALTGAQVQQGAAQGAAGLGGQQMQGLQSGIEAQLNQLATQWNMNYDQKQALRNDLMGMGGNMVTMPYQMNMMKQMFGKG